MAEKILIVDDEQTIRDTLSEVLQEEGYYVSKAVDGHDALKQIGSTRFDLALCDIVMPEVGGMEVLKTIRKSCPSTFVVMMTAFGTIKDAVEMLKQGATDYIVKPFVFDELLLRLKRIFEERRLIRLNQALKEEVKKQRSPNGIVGSSKEIQSVLTLIKKVAPINTTVLIIGKSGTGKEVVANAIHEKSPRAKELFLPINCAAIPFDLFESEMFGSIKGAFTGASQNREGFFKMAHGGTLFLDEICSVPLQTQAKLLRVLETQEIIQLGGKGIERVDVRIIAATNKNLSEEVQNNRFREDLYYRLKVFEIDLPTLQERKHDIPVLTEHFINEYNVKFHKNIKGVESSVMKRFLNYAWKGNIRELENVIERAMIVAEHTFITEKDISMDFSEDIGFSGNKFHLKEAVGIFEKEHIKNVLKKAPDDKKKAAGLLGLSLSSLYRKIEELGIDI